MPPPKDPAKYALWLQRQRAVKCGKQTDKQKAATDAQRNVLRPEAMKARIRETILSKRGATTNTEWRMTPEFKSWKQVVRARDAELKGGILCCMDCGISEVDYIAEQKKQGRKKLRGLGCHHTFPADDYPEYRYDVDKGLTLCENCHRKADAILQKEKTEAESGLYDELYAAMDLTLLPIRETNYA